MGQRATESSKSTLETSFVRHQKIMKYSLLVSISVLLSFGVAGQNCDDLFISAYLEDGSNKALEIYNPTSSSISLDNYSLRRYSNGSSSYTTIPFTTGATIASNGVYVMANTSSNATLLALANQQSGAVSHNGNDWYALYQGSTLIDLFGIIGNGLVQSVGTGSTEDQILKRKNNVLSGVSTWNTSEWDVHPKTSYSLLGIYDCGCHSDVRDFITDDYNYSSGGGFYPSLGGIGLWANTSGNKEAFVSYELCTDETNVTSCANTARFIQVGDVLSFQMKGSQAYGEVGVILNANPSFSGYASKNSNAALELYLGGLGNNWQIIHNGSNISTIFSTTTSQKTYDVNIELTSKSTAKVTIDDGTNSASYHATLANQNISHITFYLKDDWNGSSNSDFFFGSDGNDLRFENSGSLTLSHNGTYGDITDPIVPGSSSSTKSLDLTFDANATIEGNINISGNLTISASKILQLGLHGSNTYSQLKVDGSITNNGTVVQEQFISSTGHHGISSPMTAGFTTTSGTSSAMYTYNSGTGAWITNPSSTVLAEVGAGFFAPVQASGGFQSAVGSFSISGTPNTSHTFNLGYVPNTATGGVGTGWNLIGNPYACSLDWTSVTKSNVNNAYYVWDASSSTYQYYAGSAVSGSYLAASSVLSGFIPPMQAFWVQSTGLGASIISTMASHGTVASTPTFYKTNPDNLILYAEDLSDTSLSDAMWVTHALGYTTEFEGDQDAWKLENQGGHVNIYSYHDGKKIAINATDLSVSTAIPVGVKASANGKKYKLVLEQIVSNQDYQVILEDKLFNSFTDISNQGYSFTYGLWQNEDPRFVLHINQSTIGVDESKAIGVKAYQQGNRLILQGNARNHSEFKIMSLDGRVVQSGQLQAGMASIEAPRAGVYIVQFEGLNSQAERVVIQ